MKNILLLFMLLLFPFLVYSQGCSDAGICSLDAYTNNNDSSYTSYISLGSSAEVGEDGVFIISPQLGVNYSFSPSWSIQAQIPYWLASHENGHVTGFSDPIVSLKYTKGTVNTSSFFVGSKIGVNHANALGDNSRSLPMAAQSSLGTTDIIAGYSGNFNKQYQIAIAGQIPVKQYNENKDVLNRYISGFDTLSTKTQNQYSYIRKSDIMVRIDYFFSIKKSMFHVGLLPVIHLADDEIKHQTEAIETFDPINNSQGLTLNIPIGYSTSLSKRWKLDIDAGFPIITRKERPDGLTRSFVLFLNLKYGFN